MTYSNYPKTKEEWWEFVNENWENILKIVLDYYPAQSDFPKDGWYLSSEVSSEDFLTAPQKACNGVIKDIQEKEPIWQNKESFKNYVIKLKEDRDVELSNIFSSTWFGMPECESIRRVPGFNVFCDLCSESYVLEEEWQKD